MKKLILAFFMVLFSVGSVYGFGESERETCNWFSQEAGDIMQARQNGASISAVKDEYRSEYRNDPKIKDIFLELIDACYDVKMARSEREMFEIIEKIQENAYTYCKTKVTEN